MAAITLKPRELELLRSIEHSARTAHSLTHANGLHDIQMAPHVIRAYLERLVKLGLILEIEDWYHITQSGVEFLADLPQVTPSTLICGASMKEPYRPPVWNVRAGAEDHRRWPSRGMGT